MLRPLAKQQAAHLLAFHLVSETTGAVLNLRTEGRIESGLAELLDTDGGTGDVGVQAQALERVARQPPEAILIRTAGGVAAVVEVRVERKFLAFHVGGEGFAVPNCRSRGKAMGGRQQRGEEHRGVHHGWLWAAANTSQRLGERADVGGAVYG